jgi:hypothetical protein
MFPLGSVKPMLQFGAGDRLNCAGSSTLRHPHVQQAKAMYAEAKHATNQATRNPSVRGFLWLWFDWMLISLPMPWISRESILRGAEEIRREMSSALCVTQRRARTPAT